MSVEEVARQQVEAEVRRRAEEAMQAEREAHGREEQARKQLEATRQRLEQEAAQRRATGEEARRKAEEVRKADQEAWRRREGEAAQRRSAEDQARKQAEQEAAQRRVEEEVRRRMADERRRMEEEAKRRAEEEGRTKADHQREVDDLSAKQRREQQAAQQRVEDEVFRRVHEERQRLEEEARRAEAATQQRREEEGAQRSAEESRRSQEEAQRRAAEEAAHGAVEERLRLQRLAEDALKAEAEATRRLDEERTRWAVQQQLEQQEASRPEAANDWLRAEEARKAEAEARRLEQEVERRRRAEEEARLRADDERRRWQESQVSTPLASASGACGASALLPSGPPASRSPVPSAYGGGAEAVDEDALQRRVEAEIRLRVEAEARKRAELARQREEEAARREEDQRQAQEEEAGQRRAAEDARRQADEDIRRRVQEDIRRSTAAEGPIFPSGAGMASEAPGVGRWDGSRREVPGTVPAASSSFARGFSQYCQTKAAPDDAPRSASVSVSALASAAFAAPHPGVAGPGAGGPSASSRGSSLMGSRRSSMAGEHHLAGLARGDERTSALSPHYDMRSPMGAQTPVEQQQVPPHMRQVPSQGHMHGGGGAVDAQEAWFGRQLKPIVEQTPQRMQSMAEAPQRGRGSMACAHSPIRNAPGHHQSRSPVRPPDSGHQVGRMSTGQGLGPGASSVLLGPGSSPLQGSPVPPHGGSMALSMPNPLMSSIGPADGLGPTVTQLPKRMMADSRGGTVPHTPQMQRQFGGDPGSGHIPEMTRAVDHHHHQQGMNGLGFGSHAMPGGLARSQQSSFGVGGRASAPHSGMVSPTGTGVAMQPGLQPNASRSTSFNNGQCGGGPPQGYSHHSAPGAANMMQQGAGGYPSMMASQRQFSPPRQHPQGSAAFNGGMGSTPGHRPGQHPGAPGSAMPPHAAPSAHTAHSLEVSQRMARANDLMQRLQQGGLPPGGPGGPPGRPGAPQAAPTPFNLNTPNLLNWAREQHLQHAQHGQARSVADYDRMAPDVDPLDFGLNNLPPPPRSAPAAEAGGGGGGGGGGYGGPPGGRFSLTVLTSDSRWETIAFYAADDLETKGSQFLEQKGLKAAFHPGLVSKMGSMITNGHAQSSVDIVDLL